jgi:mRNA interferase YafQ
MRKVIESARFRKDFKIQRKRGKDIGRLVDTISTLAELGRLPASFHPHPLKGKWKGVWDCHIEPDWLLLYEVDEEAVTLYRTGTHADLFK